jgi:predicted nucleotidyltransferase
MKTLGIIVEYNPMHFGHIYHIEQAKKIVNPDVTIAVMSGNVVQRGDFSVYDKFIRTKTALNNGVDIVVELPSFFTLQSADYFAHAAIYLLDQLGVKDLVFGSESGDIKSIEWLLKTVEDATFQTRLKALLDTGKSYPDAFVEAVENPTIKTYLTPNNTLGLSYLKAIKALKSDITPHTIQRKKRAYYEPFKAFQHIQSASGLRQRIHQGSDVSTYLPEPLSSLTDLKPLQFEDFYEAFRYRLLTVDPSLLSNQYGFSEGLENRFLKNKHEEDMVSFIEAVKTPRYTYAHLNRAMMHFLLQTPKRFETYETPPYIRVLGFTKKGQMYLNQIKKQLEIPLYTSAKKNQHPLLDFEMSISLLYDTIAHVDLLKKELNPPITL